MLSEISQLEKDKYNMISFMWILKQRDKLKTDLTTENKLMATVGMGEIGEGD